MKQSLGKWFIKEYVSSLVRGLGGNQMVPGSANGLVTGENFIRAFRGVTALAGKVGSRILFNTDQSWAGLGTAVVNGVGSIFNVRQLLGFVGAGQVAFAGLVLAGIIASSTLSFVKKSGGVYAAGALTGPFQAGHAQPSAPTIYAKTVPSAGQTPITASVAVKIWRVSDITGQVSLASLPSNVLILNNQSVIVQIGLVDGNGQTHWGIGVPKLGFDELGNFYELPTGQYGEVAEATLAYTRDIGAFTVAAAASIVVAAGGAFTSADIGRRVAGGGYDSWITSIIDGTNAQCNDVSADAVAANGTITHAVDGYTRAVEISWTNGALQNQNLVPDKAFPPPALQFAGAMNDVLWGEGDGIIYVGEPGFIGSFPPSNALLPNEPAIQYLPGEEGVTLRLGKHSFGALIYVGGSPALQYQEIWRTQGILHPQNVAIGARSRVLMWLGKPAVLGSSIDPDYGYASKVMPDFAGWDEGQTADAPIVPGYDARGEYEVWCWKKKVMAKYVPKEAWCSPIDLTGKISGNIVAAVTHEKLLYLSCSDGATLTIYQFDVGTGSVMVIQTDEIRPNGYGATISEFLSQMRVDNVANPVKIELVVNYDDDVADRVLLHNAIPSRVGVQDIIPAEEPNVIDAKQIAVRVEMTSVGGITVNGMPVHCGVDFLEVNGETNEVRTAA